MAKDISDLWQKILRTPIDPFSFYKSEDDKMIPPKRLDFVGGGDFVSIGRETLMKMIELGGLKPEDRVLDVGCGVGRLAIPLTGYLSAQSTYEGFDIIAEGIKWCNKKIAPRFPNFHFQVANIYNKLYNPTGEYEASDYAFPYKNESFDFVFLTSIFTHMLTMDVQNYLSEISRVLKRGGRSFITYFILDDVSRSLMEKGKTSYRFNIMTSQGCYISRKDIPEAAVAYDEDWIRNMYIKYGLSIREPIFHGTWRDGVDPYIYPLAIQDTIVAYKLER
jgi:ubiquinone/menaquinone biosynthesis C-methylase UbiE